MARRLEIHKCYVCGHVVEVVHGGEGTLFCCGRSMAMFSERTVDTQRQEYYPVVRRAGDTVHVEVMSDVHDLAQQGHHIQWIEVIAGALVCRRFLAAKDPAAASFTIPVDSPDVSVRAYCTQRGLCVEKGV